MIIQPAWSLSQVTYLSLLFKEIKPINERLLILIKPDNN